MTATIRRTLCLTAALLIPLLDAAVSAYAAAPAFTASQQAAFDRTMAAAEPAQANKLMEQYRSYGTLRQLSGDWERKIADLHYAGEEKLVVLRKKIKQIDSAKLAGLKQSSEQTKERYRRLFELYRSVNLQLDAARKLKSKTVTGVLRTEADSLKIPVRLAREEIRRKETAYEDARKAASAKMKKVRDTLAAADPLQVQIKAAKNALSAMKESRGSVWKTFTSSLNKHDGKAASELLGSVNALSRQIVERLEKIHTLETRIASIIRSAETQISPSA